MEEFKEYLRTLLQLPFVKAARAVSADLRQHGADATFKLSTPTGDQYVFVESKQAPLHAAQATQLALRMRDWPRPALVVAPYVDAGAEAVLANHNIGFVDAMGNCHLVLGDHYIAQLRKPGAPAKAAEERAWRPASYRVLFALLAAPKALGETTTRQLMERAGGGSPQTAADVLTKLKARGVLLTTRNRRTTWAPDGFARALELFVMGFSTTLAPALRIGRYRAKEQNLDALERSIAGQLEAQPLRWAWGGGAACQRLSGYYRGQRTLLYVAAQPPTLAPKLGLVRDAAGPIILAHPPGPLAFDEAKNVTHPILTYADLLTEEEPRAREAASQLYDDFIRPHAERPS